MEDPRMTDDERQGLRRYLAEKLMGWKVSGRSGSEIISLYIDNVGQFIMPRSAWRPDDPTTGQVWQVTAAMEALGWGWSLYGPDEHCDCYHALFKKTGALNRVETSNNPCVALCLAAVEALKAVEVK